MSVELSSSGGERETPLAAQEDVPRTQPETQAESAPVGPRIALDFLSPSTKPGSLGRLAHYEVLEVLGKGGFGIVLKALDDKLRRVVALKVLAPQLATDAVAHERFLREARAAAAVRHEHVVTIYAVEEEPVPFLALECISGPTLQDKLDRCGPLPIADVLRLGQEIAEGLAAAHAQGMVHRDVKPRNILLEGAGERVKITDFGLARAVDDDSVTQSGVAVGTPAYMSPEQADGLAVDHRSDLFSLGTVLYVMCTGRAPFRASGVMGVLRRIIDEPPPPIRGINPDIPRWLDDFILKLHAKKPEDRFQTAQEVVNELGRRLAELSTGHDPAIPGKSPEAAPAPEATTKLLQKQRPSSRRKWCGLLAGTLALGAVVALLALIRYWNQPQEGSDGPAPNKEKDKDIQVERSQPKDVPARPGRGGDWVALFNGKDLTGWKPHPDYVGNWRVEDGILIGSGPTTGYLFTERADFDNFHLRLEARIAKGDSGVFFRSPGRFKPSKQPSVALLGYEVQIVGNPHLFGTGSLLGYATRKSQSPRIMPNTWFTIDVVAQDSQIVIKIDDQVTASLDAGKMHTHGHLALQQHGTPETWVEFRKIEIKEMPGPPGAEPVRAVVPFDAAKARAHQEAWARHLGMDVEITNSIGMKLRLIPAGEFTMGSTPPELSEALLKSPAWNKENVKSEGPARQVTIERPFYLGIHEVTVGQFREFVKQTGHSTWGERTGKGGRGWDSRQKRLVLKPGFIWTSDFVAKTVDHPVVLLHREDVLAFCAWLSKKENRTYELPREEPWEFACRAGTASRWFWGDNEDKTSLYCWFEDHATSARQMPVGLKLPNPFGLYDMTGNVAETALDRNGAIVMRGGHAGYDPNELRSAAREIENHSDPTYRNGFRVAIVGDLKLK